MQRMKLPGIHLKKRDAAAAALFFLLAFFLFFSARYAEVIHDEHFYYTIAQRFFQGDRFLVDEWHVTQFSAVFLLLPYKLFTAVTGGTAGLVLFLRHVFVCTQLILYWFYYLCLRSRTRFAAVAAALFCSDFFAGIVALNYYNMAPQAIAVAGMILFLADGKLPALKIVFAGIVFSCAVVNVPTLAVLYFLYSALVLIRASGKKRQKDLFSADSFVVNGRVWGWLSVGILASAAVFLLLLLSGGVGNIFENLPQLLTDSDHSLRWYGNASNPEKLSLLPENFGLPGAVLPPVLAAVCAIYMKSKKKKASVRAVLLAAACLVVLYAEIAGFSDKTDSWFRCSSYPAVMFSLTCCLLCETKDRRMRAFWFAAVLCSLAADYVSDLSLLFFGRIAYLPGVFFLDVLLKELKEAFGKEKTGSDKKAFRSAAVLRIAGIALLLCGILTVRSAHIFTQTDYFLSGKLHGAGVTVSEGPDKGIIKMRSQDRLYTETRIDLDLIRRTCSGAFYVAGRRPYCYLYLNELPIGAYSTYYLQSDSTDRLLRYWQLHPEKRPDCVYIPYGADRQAIPEDLVFLESLCETRVKMGLQGRIVRLEWE